MADDLNQKLRAELDEMKADIRRLQRANPLEAASVTSGRVRFIGGQLLIDAGGNLLVNGTLAVNGTSTVTGSFTVSGPWKLSGTGEITGNVTITGNITSTGTLTQNGPWNMNGAGTIAGNVTQTGNTDQRGNVNLTGGGKLTAGNVTVEPNKVTVGTAPAAATLQNGELELSNGAKLAVGLTGGTSSIGLLPAGGTADVSVNTSFAWLRAAGSAIVASTVTARMEVGDCQVIADSTYARLQNGTRYVRVSANGVALEASAAYAINLPTGAPAGAKAVMVDPSNGRLYRAA